MTSFSPGSELPAGRASLVRRTQRCWLALLFVVGLGYAALIPPFLAVDEVAHWDRIWTVAQGQYNCESIPVAAAQFVHLAFRFDRGTERKEGPVSWSLFEEAYAFQGGPGQLSIATNGCHYPPIGYLASSLAVRLFTPGAPTEPHPHSMFIAFYAARFGNLVLFFVCVLAALRVSRYPMPVLLFASIPMVVHQAVSLNNDALLFGGVLLAAALATGTVTRRRVLSSLVLIALMSAIKPVCVVSSTLLWISLWRGYQDQTLKRFEALALGLGSLALPLGAWFLWQQTESLPILGHRTGVPVSGVTPSAQWARLVEEPWRFVQVLGFQLQQFFESEPIRGSWKGMVLVFGWCRYEAPGYVYAVSLAALAAGLPSLRAWTRGSAPEPRVPWLFSAAVIGAVVAYCVAVTMTMYLVFTGVGADYVTGVQGRYLLYAFALPLFLYPMARTRPFPVRARWRDALALASLGLGVASHIVALVALRFFFWEV